MNCTGRVATPRMPASRHGNLQKHLNPNPLQRWLLKRFHRRIVDLVSQIRVERILDTGCGEGFTLAELERGGEHAWMVGVDVSLEALAWNQNNQVVANPLVAADLHHLPFPDDFFDLVLCLEVMEHVPDSLIGLLELLRVSSRYVLVSVPHEPFFRGANFLRGKHVRAFGNDPEHVHNYTGRAFRHLVSDAARLIWHGYSFPWQIALLEKPRG